MFTWKRDVRKERVGRCEEKVEEMFKDRKGKCSRKKVRGGEMFGKEKHSWGGKLVS